MIVDEVREVSLKWHAGLSTVDMFAGLFKISLSTKLIQRGRQMLDIKANPLAMTFLRGTNQDEALVRHALLKMMLLVAVDFDSYKYDPLVAVITDDKKNFIVDKRSILKKKGNENEAIVFRLKPTASLVPILHFLLHEVREKLGHVSTTHEEGEQN